LLNFQD